MWYGQDICAYLDHVENPELCNPDFRGFVAGVGHGGIIWDNLCKSGQLSVSKAVAKSRERAINQIRP